MTGRDKMTVSSRSPATWATMVVIVGIYLLSNAGPTVAQTDCDSYYGWQAYYSSWFNQYPSYAYYNMYPFGTSYCDSNATTGEKSVGFNPIINFRIPFYGSTWQGVWISPYGYVMLNETSDFSTPVMSYIQTDWPNTEYPTTDSVDPPFIAPFYAYINYRSGMSYEPSQISYRILDTRTTTSSSRQNIMTGMLAQISLDVRAATVGSVYFRASRGLVITYYNVTFFGDACQTSTNLYDTCLRNTFQMAIVTDEIETYTVFNYFNITWVGSNSYQNCDPATGQASADYPNCIPAQIGFNSGFARGFTDVPYSMTSNVINMHKLGGTNVTGRWIYRISGDVVKHGGCTNDTSQGVNGNGTWPLVINPWWGPMFGGNVVNVSGPCFLQGQSIMCKFGTARPVTAYYWDDMMQVMCVQPVLYEIGPIQLSVSIDGGLNYYFSTTYYVYEQERVPNLGVTVTNTNNDWLNPTTIDLTWNAANLTSEWGNEVTIQLLGYFDKTWTSIYTFAYQAENTGTYTITYDSQMCYNQNHEEVCGNFDLGVFRVGLSNWQWDIYNPMARWSPPIPLGWFMKDRVENERGSGWASDYCNSWYNEATVSLSWRNYLPPCPCTVNQSYIDFGLFQPTPDCNLDNYKQPGTCTTNQGAMACYESTNITSYGSSTRCCYDTYGNLLYSGDAQNGSISSRSATGGMYPYMDDPWIPSISHWNNDLMPYYYCCQWQNDPYDCFNLYMNLRTTQDCKNYDIPGHATAYGDPHFNTMDGTLYSFNAWGEFWLLYIVDAQVDGGRASFSLQGRFEQPQNQSWGQIRATIMTAAAMQLNNGTIISVINNLYNIDENLLIYANNTLLNFTDLDTSWLQYPDFIIINNDPIDKRSYSNFTIIFRIGIGVNVAWKTGIMEMFVTIPPELKRQTGGLFGYWNDDPNDDLMPRGTNSIPVQPEDSSSVFYSFGMTWMVQSTESIFTYLYRAQLNYDYYRNEWFVPYFTATMPPNATVTEGEVNSVCGSDSVCEYDYMVTQNKSVAQDTHAITEWDKHLRSMGAYVTSCGWLNIPNSVKQQPVCYNEACQVTILDCMQGFSQSGTQDSYLCQSTGYQTAEWTPDIDMYCSYDTGLTEAEIAGITIGVVVFVTLCVIAIVLFIIWYRRRKDKRKDKESEAKTAAETATTVSAVPQLAASPMMRDKDMTTVRQSPTSYNNVNSIVTGALPESYLDKTMSHLSRSTSPSKMSVLSDGRGVPQQQLGTGVRLSVTALPTPPPRSSRSTSPISPIQTVTRTVTYTTDPTAVRYGAQGLGGSGSIVESPYSVPSTRHQQHGQQVMADRAADYYNRRYGAPMRRSASRDSEV